MKYCVINFMKLYFDVALFMKKKLIKQLLNMKKKLLAELSENGRKFHIIKNIERQN